MSYRWLTSKDLSAAVRAQNIFNSRVKRGEIDMEDIASTRYVVCGCGEEGCGFMSILRRNQND